MSRTLEQRREHYLHAPKNKPRVAFRQVLAAGDSNGCVFYALIIDPETQKQIAEVPIYKAVAGECVELALARFTIMDDGFVPE